MKLSAFENNCARRVLRTPWTAKVTNVEVWERLHENYELLQSIKIRKLGYFGHIMRQESLSIENLIITGLVPGSRSRGRPTTAWIDNIVKWTGLRRAQLVQATRNRVQWNYLSCHYRVQPSAPRKDWNKTNKDFLHWWLSGDLGRTNNFRSDFPLEMWKPLV